MYRQDSAYVLKGHPVMSSSSSPGFDLRGAVDGLRQAFGSPSATVGSPEAADGGDIRAAILLELSDEPMHGYQIIRAVEARSDGAWKPTPGAVYPALQVLVDEGLISAAQVGERKIYALTDAGRRAAAESVASARSEPTSEPQQPAGQGLHGALALTKSGARLAQVMTQVAQTGDPGQSERAIAVVDEARRKLYAILAEE